ncbi:MAG: hypothetical protein IT495_16955 [Gammaproteobacteria bacterium]|nr:hypothetical protein [Gammaproteobacteria bacterium]
MKTGKQIGPSFGDELVAAELSGLPFSWGEDGTFEFQPGVTDEQRDSVLTLVSSHDPARESDAAVKNRLADIDRASIRAIREYIAARPDAPIDVVDREAEAIAERTKLGR